MTASQHTNGASASGDPILELFVDCDRALVLDNLRQHFVELGEAGKPFVSPDIEHWAARAGQLNVELSQDEIEKTAIDAWKQGVCRRKAPAETEAGDRFASIQRGRFSFDVSRRCWRECRNGIWRQVAGNARNQMREIAPALKRARTIEASLRVASWQLEGREWNLEHGAAFEGGWIEFETGTIHGKPNPGIYATRAVVEPAARVPAQWTNFVRDQICAGATPQTLAARQQLAEWLQAWAWAAFSCQGPLFEKFIFLQGQPGGGKTTFADAIRIAFGGHGMTIAGERIAGQDRAHREWLAQAHRRRLIVVNELPPTRATWKSADLSQLVSGEEIQANFMRQNSFGVEFHGGLLVTGNTRPQANPESGIFRRMALIQVQAAQEPRTSFKRQILDVARSGGVTRWVLEGRRYFDDGVLEAEKMPACIRVAVEEYRSDQDSFGAWLSERCEQDLSCEESARMLHSDYCDFANRKVSSTWLGLKLRQNGFERLDKRRPIAWRGLRLRQET